MPIVNLNYTVGAIEVGVLVSMFLFGVVSCQTWVYYRRFPTDAVLLKLLVATIWFLELGHTIAITHYLYTMTVLEFGNVFALVSPPKSLGSSILFSAFIGPLVQAWFAYRVLKLSAEAYIPAFCWLLSFLRCAATVAVGIEALLSTNLLVFKVQWKWLLTFILAVGAAVDVIIASSLCYFFRQLRATSFKRTVKVINQMMIWTIETGLLTSVAAVTMLVCFLLMQDNFIWIAIYTFLAKLFSNSFLVSLNARDVERLREPEPEPQSSTFFDVLPSESMRSSPSPLDTKGSLAQNYHGIAIEMSQSTVVKRDDGFMDGWHYAMAI